MLIAGDNDPRAKLYNITTRKLLNIIFPTAFDISMKIIDVSTCLYFFIKTTRSPKTDFVKLVMQLKGK